MSQEKREWLIQLIPAPGWVAVFTNGNQGDEVRPLAAWALAVDEAGVRRMVGMVAQGYEMVLADDDEDFVMYEPAKGTGDEYTTS